MPSISNILDSVSVPSLIKDTIIRKGQFEKSSRGLVFYSGGFTVVFPVLSKGKKWAFRCWHTEIGNVRNRFRIISKFLKTLNSSYFFDLHYFDAGLIVDGKIFPTTRMEWVEGKPLNQYIIDNAENKDLLFALSERFIEMISFLHNNKIAHGDLQHGNILVTKEGDLKLVDYDSLFVPDLEGCLDIITGKADYQHPNRRLAKISSEKLDYFSELVIYLSILAVAQDHTIINSFSIEDSLLFKVSDWEDFPNSEIYKYLKNLKNNTISLLVDILLQYLAENDINNLKPFTEEWKIITKYPTILKFQCGKANGIVYRNHETEIEWEVQDCQELKLGSTVLPSLRGSSTLRFNKDQNLKLTACNGLHTITRIIHVRVVDAPFINFRSEKTILQKTEQETETTQLIWDVESASKIELTCDNKIISTAHRHSGLTITPPHDSVYCLTVTGLDNKTVFTTKLEILVREPASAVFSVDKSYTLPNVPVRITWSVKGGRNIFLNNHQVENFGSMVDYPSSDKLYILRFEDDFGKKEKTIQVKSLPLPIISAIAMPMPEANQRMNIKIISPKINCNIPVPSLQSLYARLDLPKIPDINQVGNINVVLPKPYSNIKDIFKQIKNKLKNIIHDFR